MAKAIAINNKQILFKEMFVGTLVYAVVLGFFNDYTSIVQAKSFSTIFFASIILQTLTYLAIQLKKQIVKTLKPKTEKHYRALMIFLIWLVLFMSKFVFVWVIDVIFGDNMNISGFFGILTIVICVTVIARLTDLAFRKLADY